MLYDYTIEPHKEDPLVRIVDEALEQFSDACVPGKWIVDVIPWLEILPEWFPGAQFKRTARVAKKRAVTMVESPFAFAKQQVASGSDGVSYVSKMLEQHDSNNSSEHEDTIKWTATTMYGAGADTIVYTMASFFLAMSVYPEIQKKAQAEIDHTVGNSRLPNFSDRENLPYVDAIITETLRWFPILPLALPHAADEEGTFDGHRIPKGAVLLPNVWWFTHDPATYHEPMEFKPERYFEPYNEPPPSNVIWGFGRRICPGRVFADASLYLSCAQTLAVFDIRKAVDRSGKEIEPQIEHQAGILTPPVPFQCRISARSETHKTLLDTAMKQYPWEESHAKDLQI
jgi:cytochrome P450